VADVQNLPYGRIAAADSVCRATEGLTPSSEMPMMIMSLLRLSIKKST